MEGAKAGIEILELPTGVLLDNKEIAKSIVFREMAGPEEDILASRLSVSQKITHILSNCVLELGTIKDPILAKKYIQKLVVTDRWFYLVHLRALSLGPDYTFEVECPQCQRKDKLTVKLTDTSVKNPPKAELLVHESKLPSGKTVRWKVADGEVEAKIEKMAKDNNAPTVALYARTMEISDEPASVASIVQLNLKDRSFFRKQIDEMEGEFDDNFKTTCPDCGHEYEGELKLDAQSFFFP